MHLKAKNPLFVYQKYDDTKSYNNKLGHETVLTFTLRVWLAMIWVVRFCDVATSDSSFGTRLALGGAN